MKLTRMNKVHLITGITGQDGLFLTSKILQENPNDTIIGISRNFNEKVFFQKLKYTNSFNNNFENINIFNINLLSKESVNSFIKDIKPNFIYNLSGPSSVYKSLIDNNQTYEEIINIFDNIFNSLTSLNLECNFFQASSSEMFAPSAKKLTETSDFLPRSPYAKAKLIVHNKIQSFKNMENINISSGIMFNHESEFRDNEYLIMKIINFAINTSKGENSKLYLGSTEILRDWSYAGDFAEAIYSINNKNKSQDYVVGSGTGYTIRNILEIVFGYFDLDWEDYILIDPTLLRKGDPISIISDPRKINQEHNWKTKVSLDSLLEKCIQFKLKNLNY